MKAFYRCVTLLRWNKGRYSFSSMPRAWHKRHNRLVADIFFFFLLFFIYFLLLLFYFLLFLFSFFFWQKKKMKRIKHEYVDKKSEFQQIFPVTGGFVTVIYFDLVELTYAHTFTLLRIFDFYTNGAYRERRRTIDLSLFLN